MKLTIETDPPGSNVLTAVLEVDGERYTLRVIAHGWQVPDAAAAVERLAESAARTLRQRNGAAEFVTFSGRGPAPVMDREEPR